MVTNEPTVNQKIEAQIFHLEGVKESLMTQIQYAVKDSPTYLELRSEYNSILKEIGGMRRVLNAR